MTLLRKIPEAAPKPLAFRPSQAPEVIGVSRSTVYAWAKDGRITIHKVSGVSLIMVEDVERLIRGEGDTA